MFGLGMGEIVLIAVVALLVLGPERLPGAAKAIGKGIRDLRAQTKALQSTIESDTQIGDAVREIKGALRGDPETLYKKVTGDDWQGSDSPPIVSSTKNSSETEGEQAKGDDATKSDESGSSDNEDSNRESLKSDDAKSDSSNGDASENESSDNAGSDNADPARATRDFMKELIDKEFSNTDDAWGKAASNPHEGDDSSNDDSSDNVEANASEPDPDMPIIKPASNTMARHEVIDDESEGDQDDQASTDTTNV